MSSQQQRGEEILNRGWGACELALGRVFEAGGQGAAIKLHLHNYTSFNATFGFKQGNALLEQVAGYLAEEAEGEIFRYGSGVSFVILLEGANAAAATAFAQKIAERFDRPWAIGAIDCICPVSVSALLYPDYAGNAQDLLANLDLALNESVKAGYNQVTIFGADLQDRLYRSSVIIRLLATAVETDQIDIRYRPTWSLADDRYTRIECHPQLRTVEFGPVQTSEFLPLAEESGVACFVSMHVLKHACETLSMLISEGFEFESLSLPVPSILLIQRNFERDLTALLSQYNIPPGKLALEILNEPLSAPYIRPVLEKLSGLGIEIVLSKFNFGLTNMQDLLHLPVDAIKLGRRFVWQVETDAKNGALVEGLVKIAGDLGVKLIAEGVETAHQNTMLERYRCPYRQGFYYSPAVSLDELKLLLSK
ncbi:MAG: GGDEF domain-containing protein [Oscillospiraceae bacterium]|nr:GGDEF domain-containing protein [Oscillospiraceae bacterium]